MDRTFSNQEEYPRRGYRRAYYRPERREGIRSANEIFLSRLKRSLDSLEEGNKIENADFIIRVLSKSPNLHHMNLEILVAVFIYLRDLEKSKRKNLKIDETEIFDQHVEGMVKNYVEETEGESTTTVDIVKLRMVALFLRYLEYFRLAEDKYQGER